MTDTAKATITLILGGARSGKSSFGETFALQTELTPLYIATSQAYDNEMRTRILAHQEMRAAVWQTIEEPLALAQTLKREASPSRIILVDCLTLWISNLMMADKDITREAAQLCDALPSLGGPVIFVSNEVGQGIVPDNAMARAFRDHSGRLHQDIAALSDQVYFLTAGIAQRLK